MLRKLTAGGDFTKQYVRYRNLRIKLLDDSKRSRTPRIREASATLPGLNPTGLLQISGVHNQSEAQFGR